MLDIPTLPDAPPASARAPVPLARKVRLALLVGAVLLITALMVYFMAGDAGGYDCGASCPAVREGAPY